jgi:hypothetical protein
MKTLMFLLSGLFISQPPLIATEISIGSTRLHIPSPEGYSNITSEMQPYEQFARRFVPPMNEQFLLLLPEAEGDLLECWGMCSEKRRGKSM